MSKITNALKVKVGSFTRDTSLASGQQVITGLGFKPKSISFEMLRNTGLEMSWGYTDGVTNKVMKHDSTPRFSYSASNMCLFFDDIAGNTYAGACVTFSDDGFTIDWTKVGTPTIMLNIQFRALG